MNAHNGKGLRLSVRAQTSALLARALDGRRTDVPIDPSTLSRYCDGQCANPLEMVATMIRSLDADRGALLVGYIDDIYEDQHGDDCPNFLTAMIAEAEADAAEDEIQVRAGMDPAALDELIARSRRQEAAGRILRRAAMRERQRRRTGPLSTRTPKWGRAPERRLVG